MAALDRDDLDAPVVLMAGAFEEALQTGTDAFMTGWVSLTSEYMPSIVDAAPEGSAVVADASPLALPPTPPPHPLALPKASTVSAFPPSGLPVPAPIPGVLHASTTSDKRPSLAKPKPEKKVKKYAYYAVLRHGNLFLYKDKELNGLKHVIVLTNRTVAIWPRALGDAELFTKRSALCIMKSAEADSVAGHSVLEALTTMDNTNRPPEGSQFLYCDNNSDKEDWYFALIRATKENGPVSGDDRQRMQERPEPTSPQEAISPDLHAQTLHFETTHVLNLILSLHSSEGLLQTKWLNAIIGRIFLSLRQTQTFEAMIRSKVEKKLARVNKPDFLSDFEIRKINVGDSSPFFSYPKLTLVLPDGSVSALVHFSYTGNLSVQIATTATLNLGARFMAKEVKVVLAVTFKKIEGTLILKIKPPPSGRIWYGFESMPIVDLVVEPVVSSRQITFLVITNAISNKFREAIRDSMVLPHMDDICFYNTEASLFRGGIWTDAASSAAETEGQDDPLKGDDSVFDTDEVQSKASFADAGSLTSSDLDTQSDKKLRFASLTALADTSRKYTSKMRQPPKTEIPAPLASPLKKLGKWYTEKATKKEPLVAAPEMISNRRVPRGSFTENLELNAMDLELLQPVTQFLRPRAGSGSRDGEALPRGPDPGTDLSGLSRLAPLSSPVRERRHLNREGQVIIEDECEPVRTPSIASNSLDSQRLSRRRPPPETFEQAGLGPSVPPRSELRTLPVWGGDYERPPVQPWGMDV